MGSDLVDTVLAVSPDAAWAELEGETVLYDPVSARVQVLNSTAGLLWNCLDGSDPVRDLLAALAEVFGVADDVVEADCLPMLETWIGRGLVAPVTQLGPAGPVVDTGVVRVPRRRLTPPPSS